MQKTIVIYLACLWLCFACKGPEGKDPCAVEFDQLAMLTNIAENIITPRYQDLKQKIQVLSDASTAFSTTTQVGELTALRTAWLDANLSWQAAMIFEFGPAGTHQLRETLNNFPVFRTRLETGIQNNDYNLAIDSFSFTRGFPALDYLLYGVEGSTENDIIAQFSTAADATTRIQFLKDVVAQIKSKVDLVHDEWTSYETTFKTTTGVATGTPMSLLINQLNQNYELFKNNKLGDPAGAKNSYVASPNKVEAYYSRRSLELALASARASQELFEGKGGLGLDDYIAATEVNKGDLPLQTVISNQFNTLISSLEALNTVSLYDAIRSDFEAVKTVYANAQNQVVYLKTDLPSVLCVSITYVDNTDDGD